MATLIFANGEFQTGEWITPYLAAARTIVGVDGGTRHVLALGVEPDWVVGDLDSLPADMVTRLEARGVRFRRFDVEKDETDLELALRYAVTLDDDPIYVAAALGARLDQMLANILLLAHEALIGRRVLLIAPHQEAWLVRDRTHISGALGDRVSLIPLGGAARVAFTSGLKWVLRDEVLRFGPARGVSNEMVAAEAEVELAAGLLLCVHTDRRWDR